MARFGCRSFVLLFLFLQFSLLKTYGKTTQVCISKGGRFPRYKIDGKPPEKVSKGPRDLVLCRAFRKQTCCDISQTYPAILSIRRLVSSSNATQECSHLWELLECSICDPWVGVQPGPPLICASFCDRVYEACSMAYFSMDQKKQVLVPCDEKELVCARASVWVSNGTELCHVAGFSVVPFDDPEDISCYGGKATMDYVKNSWKNSEDENIHVHENIHELGDFTQWISDYVSWIVVGILFTILLGFISTSKSRNKRRRERGVQNASRKLGRTIGSAVPGDQVKRIRIGQESVSASQS